MNKKLLSLAFFIMVALQGCNMMGSKPTPKKVIAPKPMPKPKPVSNRPGYTKGDIFIAEYHRILPKEGLYTRSLENFKKDLEFIYKLGFRPVTVTEIIEDKMNLAPGASPIALTFDDSTLSQFKLDVNGNIAPDCAIGVLNEFAKTHPDFPVKATFYILPYTPFEQKQWVDRKMAMLKQWGCEIGSHTVSHKSLRSMSEENIKKELATSIDWIRTLGFEPKTMAVPYGNMPKKAEILSHFVYNDKEYGFKANVRSMARPARSFKCEKPENPIRLPRILGDDQHMALTYWLKKVEAGEVGVYVQPQENEQPVLPAVKPKA